MINGSISVIVVFLIMVVGFYFTKRNKWPDNTNKVFSTTVVKIAAPSLAIVSIENRFTPELLQSSVINLIIITFTVFLMHFIGKLLVRLLKLPPKKKAVFVTTFTFNNAMFIGLPINTIVFGHDGLPYLFTFYLVTIVLFWSLGAYTLCNASDLSVQKDNKVFSWKKILSPGLIGVFIGCFLAGFALHLPRILETSLAYLGDICVPLSLLVIGSNLARSLSKGFQRITFDQILIMMGKFLIHPAIMFGAFTLSGPAFLGLTSFTAADLPFQVFVLCAALPCHAQTAILAEFYDLEGEYASNLVSLSTLICLFTIPVYAGMLL